MNARQLLEGVIRYLPGHWTTGARTDDFGLHCATGLIEEVYWRGTRQSRVAEDIFLLHPSLHHALARAVHPRMQELFEDDVLPSLNDLFNSHGTTISLVEGFNDRQRDEQKVLEMFKDAYAELPLEEGGDDDAA